jgi:alpha-1,3-mannosyltransferase
LRLYPRPLCSFRIGTILSAERISPYISAILNPSSTVLPRLECPVLNVNRYKILQGSRHGDEVQDPQIDYFFALNLRDCIGILPRLMDSIVEAVRFLGPHRCALSIAEGNSPDGTSDVLSALKPFLEDIGLVYFYNSSKINPAQGNARIHKLAQLRNLALTPLYKEQVKVTDDTTVLFINDVSACAEDILELALQRHSLNADMTCAMDWTYVGPDPTFYDIWIARTISGDSFFEVGSDGNWNSAWNLFWSAPDTRGRYYAKQPFQVFACWNGATAFTAAPLLHGLRFRDTRKGECFQGEPQLFCKDMWYRGFRKIAVVPSVNLEYSDEKAADIKKLKGYVSGIVEGQEDSAIDWVFDPPEQVRCMPTWDKQSWRPWNETL